jgi:KipI family sensor histidine kinase inhibitor
MSVAMDLTVAAHVLDCGDRALLLEFDRTADVLAWTTALRKAALPGVTDIVPASRTVLVKLDAPRYQGVVRQRVRKMRVGADAIPAAEPHQRIDAVIDAVIDVVYDGADLGEVAELSGLSTAQVVNAHTSTPWQVAFGGFAPGFAYLTGGDPRLSVPVRSEERAAVPAGSVALAGEFSGLYPRRAPSRWQVIGHTAAVLWDIDRANPALLTPGLWVQFRAA